MAKKPAGGIEDDEAFEWAARDLYETTNGVGSWIKASTAERSRARLMVRVVLATFAKHGWQLGRKTSSKLY